MWITIYFKSGKIIETIIDSFSEIDNRYEKEDILQIDIGCTMNDENKEKQRELLILKKNAFNNQQSKYCKILKQEENDINNTIKVLEKYKK